MEHVGRYSKKTYLFEHPQKSYKSPCVQKCNYGKLTFYPTNILGGSYCFWACSKLQGVELPMVSSLHRQWFLPSFLGREVCGQTPRKGTRGSVLRYEETWSYCKHLACDSWYHKHQQPNLVLSKQTGTSKWMVCLQPKERDESHPTKHHCLLSEWPSQDGRNKDWGLIGATCWMIPQPRLVHSKT